MKSKFEQIIKEKVDNFEFDYDPKEWSRLENKMKTSLPKSKGLNNLFYSAIIAVVVISAISVAYLSKNTSKKENQTKNNEKNITTSNQSINSNTHQILSQEKNIIPVSDIAKNESSTKNYPNKNNESTAPFIENPFEKASSEKPNDLKISPYIASNTPESIINYAIYQSENEGCTPLSVDFNAGASNQNIIYTWDFGDGATSTGFSVKHTYRQAGNFHPTLTISNIESSKSNITLSSSILVKESPNARMSWTAEENSNTYTFRSNSLNATSYEWDLNNQLMSYNDHFSKDFYKNDSYSIKLIAKNSNGCADTISENVLIQVAIKLNMPNAFTPDGDGINDEFGPVADDLYNVDYHMVIYDKSGSLVFETNNPAKKWDGINIRTNKIATTTTDVFVWKIVIKDQSGTHTSTGSVMLLCK